jgi:hypothetical protein
VAIELLVVVIGLFLALQLDRWREDRADRRQEQVYVGRLIADLAVDIPSIELAIDLQPLRLEMVDLLIEVAQRPQAAVEAAAFFLGSVVQSAYTYTPTLTSHTFVNLRTTGDLRLIRDEEVKQSLFRYYGYDEEQRQYRPLQFATEHRHFELAAGVLTLDQSKAIQDRWWIFRPADLQDVREFAVDPDEVLAAAERLRGRHDLVSWLPYVRSMQLEQIVVHGKRLELVRQALDALRDHARQGSG